ncbi:hypothetical protein Vadar_030357 [Vaccinium darrowii]|uniref:Uncharacterized protein n=1 Tax=Vaccinium darrowii TaxID=229202 RepID=A0ACB7Z8K6_9ERIC|nr:hypothetical protein Vadar_030357 [Vaccinium darrowii]
MQRLVLVDQKVRTDKTYLAAFMDDVSIPKTNENFPLLYDTKGRFRLHSIRDEEAKGIPYINTYDGRTIRYPVPIIKANDTIKLDLEANKITDFIKFDAGDVVMVTGGRNSGRVGVIKNWEKHKGSFETIQSCGCPFLRARVSNCPSLRRLGRGLLPKQVPLHKLRVSRSVSDTVSLLKGL